MAESQQDKKTILILDDEPHVVTYLETLLEDNGFQTVSASNGREGMEKLKERKPDLVCLDMSMPEQSGVRFYRNLKDDPDLSSIPVLIVTAVTGYGGDPEPFRRFISTRKQVPPPDGFKPEEEGFHTSDADIGAYYRPEVGNMILTGSVDPECDPKEWVDPDEFNREVTQSQWKAQVYRLARRFPNLPVPSQPIGIVDLYDVSDDWIPIYDKSDLNGYYQAIGTSGNQFKTAPVVGAMLMELIRQVEKGYDHDAEPLQYKLPHLGFQVDVGAFRRNREINRNSSFSVAG